MIKSKCFYYLIACILAITVCQNAAAVTVDLTGYWQGSWNSRAWGEVGDLSVTLNQSGDIITGTLDITNTDCGTVTGVLLTGKVLGNNFTLDGQYHCNGVNTLRYTSGVVNGNAMSGNYTVYAGNSSKDWGTFSFTRAANILSASAGPGGSISPSGAISVNAGSSKVFTISPNSGYRIADVQVDGNSVGSVLKHTFSNIQANHSITVSFAKSVIIPGIPLLLLREHSK